MVALFQTINIGWSLTAPVWQLRFQFRFVTNSFGALLHLALICSHSSQVVCTQGRVCTYQGSFLTSLESKLRNVTEKSVIRSTKFLCSRTLDTSTPLLCRFTPLQDEKLRSWKQFSFGRCCILLILFGMQRGKLSAAQGGDTRLGFYPRPPTSFQSKNKVISKVCKLNGRRNTLLRQGPTLATSASQTRYSVTKTWLI